MALHRARSNALVADFDLMGPPVADRDDPEWERDGDVFTVLDPVTPDWRPYFYRAVAYGEEDPTNGKRAGRSNPSAVIRVLVPPVVPPDLTALDQQLVAGGTVVRVWFRSSAEIRVTPLGVHRLEVYTIKRMGVPVPVETLHAQAELPSIAPLAGAMPATPGVIRRGNRDAARRWLYQTFVPREDDDVAVRMFDPMGRLTELREPLIRPVGRPDLVDLRARRVGFTLRVSVRSSAPITEPPEGAFLLEVFAVAPVAQLLAGEALHRFGTAPALGQWVRSGPDFDGRFTYSIRLGFLLVTSVRVRLTDPDGLDTELIGSVS